MPITTAAIGRATSRSVRAAVVVFAAAVLIAACSAAAPNPTGQGAPTPTGGQPTVGQPTPTSGGLPTPGGQPTPGGGGGGPTLPDGQWSAGTVHLVVSGDVSGTYDAPLVQFASFTTGGTTVLSYVAQNPQANITLSIDSSAVAVSVTTAEWVGGAGTTDDAPCSATFARADASAIDGTIACTDVPFVSMTTGGLAGAANFQVSFTATR